MVSPSVDSGVTRAKSFYRRLGEPGWVVQHGIGSAHEYSIECRNILVKSGLILLLGFPLSPAFF
jgi:hypothetical protein